NSNTATGAARDPALREGTRFGAAHTAGEAEGHGPRRGSSSAQEGWRRAREARRAAEALRHPSWALEEPRRGPCPSASPAVWAAPNRVPSRRAGSRAAPVAVLEL